MSDTPCLTERKKHEFHTSKATFIRSWYEILVSSFRFELLRFRNIIILNYCSSLGSRPEWWRRKRRSSRRWRSWRRIRWRIFIWCTNQNHKSIFWPLIFLFQNKVVLSEFPSWFQIIRQSGGGGGDYGSGGYGGGGGGGWASSGWN